MKYCNCPAWKIVMDMMASIEFDELTGHEDDYKQIFKELVQKYLEEEKTSETDQVVKSKVS